MVTRRELIQAAGVGGLGLLFPRLGFTQDPDFELPRPKLVQPQPLAKPVTGIIIGHGGRGGLYGYFASQMPDQFRIVGVAEPVNYRNRACADTHGIPTDRRFDSWEGVFDGKEKWADVCVIATPDDKHYEPAMAALEKGYDLLLEKPIAMTWDQCRDIYRLAQQKGAVVGICHVLRYAPFFQQLAATIRSGLIGDVVSVQHLEPIQHVHMSASYVRGIWRNTKISCPIILAKSCHDLDLLTWFVDKPCTQINGMGQVSFFRPENAPAGAPEFCIEGCPVEKTCAYHAPRLYVTERRWTDHYIVNEDRSQAAILERLKSDPAGRCVFRSDNDQPEHFVSTMTFAGGATATCSVEGMTSYAGRRTRIMGTKGDIVGDERYLDVHLFESGKAVRWDVTEHADDLGGHGGGDVRMVRDFVQAVARRDPSLLSTNLANSMESHLMGFQAEASRLGGGGALPVDVAKELA